MSGRKRRKRGIKSVQSPQHRTIILIPLYDRSVGLNFSCLNLLCKAGSPDSAHTAISPICNSIPHNDTVGKFSTKLTGIPCSHSHFLPRGFVTLWCSAVTSQHSLKLSHCPIKQDPCPCLHQTLPRAASQSSDEPKCFRMVVLIDIGLIQTKHKVLFRRGTVNKMNSK